MTIQELKDHFKTELENYSLERKKMEKFLTPELSKKFPEITVMEMAKIIFKDILSELPDITDKAIISYKKGLNFKLDKKEREQYAKDKIKDLEKAYERSPFAHWFTIDDFHNEIFKENALKQIFESFLYEVLQENIFIEGALVKENDIDFSKIDITKIEYNGRTARENLLYTFFIIIKAKVLKIEFKKLQTANDKIREKLTPDFLNELRLCYSTTNWVFGNEKIEIVPKNLTHDFLMRNNPIGKNILKYYFLPTSRFISDAEYQKMVNTGYVGQKDATLVPYPFIIYGAYFGRIDLYTKLSLISFKDEKPYLNGNNNLHYFVDFIPYFKEYAEGFKEGYNKFEDNCITPFLPMFADKQDYILKVHEYLTKRIFFQHDWLNNHCGFTINHNFKTEKREIIDANENGLKQGYFYRAWTIVFSNSQLFEPLFVETMGKRAKSDSLKKQKPQQNNNTTKDQILKEQNNLIPKVSIGEVFKHFEVLTKATNKDGVIYLTEKQLLNFVKNTFIDKEPKQQEFNGFLYSKKDVRSVFYRFYKKSTLLENKQTGLKQKYFDIMNKSFSGFNKTDFNEFNKTNNTIAP